MQRSRILIPFLLLFTACGTEVDSFDAETGLNDELQIDAVGSSSEELRKFSFNSKGIPLSIFDFRYTWGHIWGHIDFENTNYYHTDTGADHEHSEYNYKNYYFEEEDGQVFHSFAQGDLHGPGPWLSPSINYPGNTGGSHAIGFWTTPDTDGKKERSEIILTANGGWNESYSLKFNRIRHVGLAFYVHRETENFNGQVVILQAVQEGHAPFPVPFVVWLKMLEGKPHIKVELSGGKSPSGVNTYEIVNGNGFYKVRNENWIEVKGGVDTWNKLAVKLYPRYANGVGHVEVRLNDVDIFNTRQYWGFDPESASDDWRISAGIYRPYPPCIVEDGEPCPVSGEGNIVLFMDNIKIGTNFYVVDPDYNP